MWRGMRIVLNEKWSLDHGSGYNIMCFIYELFKLVMFMVLQVCASDGVD